MTEALSPKETAQIYADAVQRLHAIRSERYVSIPATFSYLITNEHLPFVRQIAEGDKIWTNILELADRNEAARVIELLMIQYPHQLKTVFSSVYAFSTCNVPLIQLLLDLNADLNYACLSYALELEPPNDCVDIYITIAPRLRPLHFHAACHQMMKPGRFRDDQIHKMLTVARDNSGALVTHYPEQLVTGLYYLRSSQYYEHIFDLLVEMGFKLKLNYVYGEGASLILGYFDRTLCRGQYDDEYIGLIQMLDSDTFKKYVALFPSSASSQLYNSCIYSGKYGHVRVLLDLSWSFNLDQFIRSSQRELLLTHPFAIKTITSLNNIEYLRYKCVFRREGITGLFPVKEDFHEWEEYMQETMQDAITDATVLQKGQLVTIKLLSENGHCVREMIVGVNGISVKPFRTVYLSNGFNIIGPDSKTYRKRLALRSNDWLQELGYTVSYTSEAPLKHPVKYMVLCSMKAPYSLRDLAMIIVQRKHRKKTAHAYLPVELYERMYL